MYQPNNGREGRLSTGMSKNPVICSAWRWDVMYLFRLWPPAVWRQSAKSFEGMGTRPSSFLSPLALRYVWQSINPSSFALFNASAINSKS